MTSLYIALGSIITIAVIVWLALREAKKRGRAEQENESIKAIFDDVHLANRVREESDRTPVNDKRKWLRDNQ